MIVNQVVRNEEGGAEHASRLGVIVPTSCGISILPGEAIAKRCANIYCIGALLLASFPGSLLKRTRDV